MTVQAVRCPSLEAKAVASKVEISDRALGNLETFPHDSQRRLEKGVSGCPMHGPCPAGRSRKSTASRLQGRGG